MGMDFNSNKPIYLQIYDNICESILSGAMVPGERIQSVREYATEVGVNPNTVMRTYDKLTRDGIIYNKRGIGFFVCDDGRSRVLESTRETFLEQELPAIVRRLRLMEMDPKVLMEHLESKDVEIRSNNQ